ncbi:UDP-glucose flavonoid 3-O-glucosyltransferase 7 [Prunus yedoensis var. nudiflora]|uniref:UDP-glucose flavonoid 3-O-glucosyltransferase 7 n=1 Tax=Prunus yedoensis var. nudiflora TaxID=2094558 RepID=A0A315A2I2_PRUYE|nr:UDP-glucose flavonoid 3-O-glucosyltransferase 7 [Prunus yedoensis var. nudiflora]
MAPGHMKPTIAMAKLFASRGIKTTIISTPQNVAFFSKTIERSKDSGFEIGVLLLKFPSVKVGLPGGCKCGHMVETREELQKFMKATSLLDQQLVKLLEEHQPNCLVADNCFPWTTDLAAKFGIPRLVFHGINFISLCISQHLIKMDSSTLLKSDSEALLIPDLPYEIKLARTHIPNYLKEETELRNFLEWTAETERKSYGVVVNSFYELEPAYADHYRKFLGIKAWHIGPTFLCNKDTYASLDEHECLKWLNSKTPNSVVYVSFGSVIKFGDAQLLEIALGLEASGQQFIWVVKKEKSDEGKKEDWLPEGFEKRVEGRERTCSKRVGSTVIEAVSAGVPMATWPAFSDQFYNEKLVTQILGIGVGVGVQKWELFGGEKVGKRNIERVVTQIMVGEKAEEMRSRAKRLGELARKSVEEDGSSYKDLNALIQELGLHSTTPN